MLYPVIWIKTLRGRKFISKFIITQHIRSFFQNTVQSVFPLVPLVMSSGVDGSVDTSSGKGVVGLDCKGDVVSFKSAVIRLTISVSSYL